MRTKIRIIMMGVVVTGSVWAQKPQDQPKRDQQKQDQSQADEQPGKEEKKQLEPEEYQGPSILSRDKSLVGERGGKLIDFRFYGEVSGVYDSGLTPVATDQNGSLAHVGGSPGVEIGGGVIGSRTWRRDRLSLEYKGSYKNYATPTGQSVGNSQFNGTDQFLNLQYARRLKRRLTLDLKETVGTSSLGNGSFSYLPLTNTDQFAVPTAELFDNRTKFLQSRVDLTWQKSARLSFGVGAEGFLVRRASLALAGLNGYRIHGDTSYRLTRRQTVTLTYGYTHFDFQRLFGNSNLHTAALGYSIGLGRMWDFSAQGGITYVQTRGLNIVQLDPAVAAILGRPTAVATFDKGQVGPLLEARLIRRFQRSSVSGVVANSITPGNGVFLTSTQRSAGIDYSYTGLRRLSIGANLGISRINSVGQDIGNYNNYQGGVGTTYKVANSTHLQFRYDYRHYNIQSTPQSTTQNGAFRKDSSRMSLGLAFSPGEKPLPIW